MKTVFHIIAILLTFASHSLAHKEWVHQYITREGYALLSSTVGPVPIMADHVGITEVGNGPWRTSLMVSGAWLEDHWDAVYHYRDFSTFNDRALVSITHFWDADDGDLRDNTFQVAWSFFFRYHWSLP